MDCNLRWCWNSGQAAMLIRARQAGAFIAGQMAHSHSWYQVVQTEMFHIDTCVTTMLWRLSQLCFYSHQFFLIKLWFHLILCIISEMTINTWLDLAWLDLTFSYVIVAYLSVVALENILHIFLAIHSILYMNSEHIHYSTVSYLRVCQSCHK